MVWRGGEDEDYFCGFNLQIRFVIVMKILLAADIFPPQSGGPATYVVTLANELVKAGDEVRIVSLNPESDESIVNCQLFIASSKSKIVLYLRYFWLLLRHAKHVDVVYAMGPVNAGLPALIAARLRRKKFFVKVVGDYAWEQGVQRYKVKEAINEFQTKKNLHLAVHALRIMQRYVCRHSAAVVVPSEYLAHFVVLWGIPQQRVQVIYNAVEITDVVSMIKPDNEKWIVSAGRLVPWKGFEAIIDIMPALLREYPQAKLKIIGDGPERQNLSAQIYRLGLENSVELIGNKPKDVVWSFIKAANGFVLNSAYEGMSHLLLEGAMLDVPVLASRIAPNLELVSIGLSFQEFEYNNREDILAILKQALLPVEKMKSNKAMIKDKFSIDKMIFKTRRVMADICLN